MHGHCLIELPRVKTKSVPTFYFFSRLGFDDLLIYYHTFIKFLDAWALFNWVADGDNGVGTDILNLLIGAFQWCINLLAAYLKSQLKDQGWK